MNIKILILAVRAFSIHLPANISYNIHHDGHDNYVIECYGSKAPQQVEPLKGIQRFTVNEDCISLDFPNGTLWLTKTGMEW
jgi:hypothetical protein